MALFSRKDKNVEMAKAVAAELAKAGYGINASPGLNGSPMSGSGYNSAYAADQPSAGQGIVTTIGQANPMPRPGLSPQGGFGAMLGPAAPLLPAPIDVVLDESGRAMPRKYEYQTAINLNLTQTEVPFATLKALTEQCDVIHRAIEIRVSDIVKQQWSFAPDASAIAAIMNEQNVTHSKAARIARELYGDEIQRLNAFWENPYVASDRSWTEWITECLWQIFAFDQLCIYPRYNLGKDLMGLDVIDAPTIKILLDNRGDIPHPPLPAYQQVLWGFPRGEFTASPDADGSFYNAPGKYGEFLTDQLAVYVKNRRTWSPYGFSPVEEAIPAASLYLNRQVWLNAEYQNGSTPMTWMRTNSQEMDHLKLAAFERVLNDTLTGSTAERHRVKVLPDGFDPVAMPTMEERWRSDYDEYIIKRISSIFGVSPASLGVVSRAGLGGGKGAAEGEAENVEVVSTRPMENYITDVVNSLCRRFLKADKNVTFVLNDATSAMEETLRNKGYQTSLFSGFMTLNDVRGEIGEPLYDMPEADEPMIVAGNAVQFLKGMLATGSNGETIGQTDGHLRTVSQSQEISQGSQASSQESAQSQVESGKGSGETNAPKLSPVGLEIPAVGAPAQKTAMADEMRDFAQFVKARTKRGNWRAFDFSTVPEFVAESLNESAYFIAKGARPMPDKLAIWAIEESERLLGDTPKGLVTKEYNPDQPRDDHGRFGSGGGSNSSNQGTGSSAGRPDVGDFQLNEKEAAHLNSVYNDAGKASGYPAYAEEYATAGQNAMQVEMANMLGMGNPATIEQDPYGDTRPTLFRGCDQTGADSLTGDLTSYGGSGGTLVGSGVYTSPDVSVANSFAKDGGVRVDCYVSPDANIATASSDTLAANYGFNSPSESIYSGDTKWSSEAQSGVDRIMSTPASAALANGYQGLDATNITGQKATLIFDRSVMSINVVKLGG